MTGFLFTSARLGFRAWRDDDVDAMAAINADPAVMEFFPRVVTHAETEAFVGRMRGLQAARGHCYFAVEALDQRGLLGFVGLAEQTFASDFTPAVDIGWRLARRAWGCGYASEAARRCLQHAATLGIGDVIAVAPRVNERSIRVMQKLGMRLRRSFEHPVLRHDARLRTCVLYGTAPPGAQDTSGPP